MRQFRTARGDRPVEEYVAALQPRERAVVLRYVRLLAELGTQLGEPQVRKMVDRRRLLYELRPGAHRLFFCRPSGGTVVLLHAYRKRSNRTPPRHLATAQRRYDEVLGGAETAGVGAGS